GADAWPRTSSTTTPHRGCGRREPASAPKFLRCIATGWAALLRSPPLRCTRRRSVSRRASAPHPAFDLANALTPSSMRKDLHSLGNYLATALALVAASPARGGGLFSNGAPPGGRGRPRRTGGNAGL